MTQNRYTVMRLLEVGGVGLPRLRTFRCMCNISTCRSKSANSSV